ncbi:uncharacterized protein LOC125232335 [Leguminivora glycinivorella]|uniref:uncharacterized protein LOC125232335 n=2 Tax=Leguminivora glycinivorella TaxID=1035111 RepID=UPI00200C6DA9|nr:uncharacterized protein LOC125232335 [Leguminivora glycinivorella]
MALDDVGPSKSRDKSPARAICDVAIEPHVRDLVKKRGIIKARLTKFATHIQSCSDDLNSLTEPCRINLKLRMQGAESLYTEFNILQTEIEASVFESNLDEQLTQREQFEDSYFTAQALAESILSQFNTTDNKSLAVPQASTMKAIKLPVLSLPSFDGTYENWLAFRDIYLSLVHNSKDLCDIQRFHYLKSSLTGSALLVIEALELTASNYAVAWELLLNRYNNNRLLIHNHVKALFSLQSVPKESHILIRKLVDTTLKNLRALKVLGEPISSWDTLIIYILVSKLDKTTEREWEQHKSSLTSSDTQMKIKLDDLLQFLRNRADMLETLQASHSQSTSTRDKPEVNKQHVTPNSTHNYNNNKVHCNAHLTYEEFSTALSQIEAVLNSRPLYAMSSDPHDFLPLSPAHFLVGRTLTSPASEDLQHAPAHRLNRYQMVEKIRQHFWARWSKEYVSELQTRSKWRTHCEDLKPNTLVLIKDDNLPPLKWQLGRIVKTIPGKDGVSRVADIRTASGIIRRAYTKICPLVSQPDEEKGGEAQESS